MPFMLLKKGNPALSIVSTCTAYHGCTTYVLCDSLFGSGSAETAVGCSTSH